MAAGRQSFIQTFKSIDHRIRQNCRLSLFLCSPPVPDGNLPTQSWCRHGILSVLRISSLIDLAKFSYIWTLNNDPPAENFGVQCQRRRQHRRPKGRLYKEKSLNCLKNISKTALSDFLPFRSLWTTSATPGRPLMLSSMWEQAGKLWHW